MTRQSSLLSGPDHERIRAAVHEAETRTSGEIYCVLARSSDSYFFPAMFTITLIIFALSAVAALFLAESWLSLPPVTVIAAQIAAFVCAWALLALVPALRPRLVAGTLLRRRAHDNAVRQFLSHNIHLTEHRTGVLIFISVAERYAEIIADDGINRRVEQEEWDASVESLVLAMREGRMADGFVSAIESTGRLLAENFPPGTQNPNELDDSLAEI